MTFLINTLSGARITLDPHNSYKNVDDDWIMQSMGLIPHIMTGGLRGQGELADTFKLRAENGYTITSGGGCRWDDVAKISDDGTYLYPEDPPRYPLAKLELGGEVAFVYESGFVAVRDNDKWINCRMD